MFRLNLKVLFIVLSCLFMSCNTLNVSYAADACPASEEITHPDKKSEEIQTHGVIPDSIMKNIKDLNAAVDAKVSRFLALGAAIQCAATEFCAHDLSLLVVKIKIPSFSLWIAGTAVWILGIMLVMIIGYYLCDISFKLGFAVMAMPISIALWPFPKTKEYLHKVISLMLNCTGIFIFLSLGVTYAIALFDAAIAVGGEDVVDVGETGEVMQTVFNYFKEEKGNEILELFDLLSFNFLLLMFAGIYGFVLVGKSVTKYTGQFFKDETGLGNANPMHEGLTQATDFVKQKAGKVGGYAKDVLKTQAGRGAAKLGGKLSGAMGRVGAGMAKAGGVMGAVGKGMQAMGNIGQKMAINHETKYQNQGKKGEMKNGLWQPKADDKKGDDKKGGDGK